MSNGQVNRLFQTNDYSILSKYSTVKTGYFEDRILEDFVETYLKPKSWRRTPLVNRGYSARLLSMDWTISRSISYEKIECFISLGAGYDTLPMKYLPHGNLSWIELDLPQVVSSKADYINCRTIAGVGSLHLVDDDTYCSTDGRYHLIACDMRDSENLSSKLKKALSAINDGTTLRNYAIVNEVCLSYLERGEIEKILNVVINNVREQSAWKIYYIGYEPVKPDNKTEFSEVMTQHFNSLGHPLKYLPTPDALKQLFLEHLNFSHVTISSMYQIYHNALYGQRLEKENFKLEPFDEFEEMDSYLSHYAIVTGALIIKDLFFMNNRDNSLLNNLMDMKIQADNPETGQIRYISSALERFGHSSCTLKRENPSILVSGGFGKKLSSNDLSNNCDKHQRLSESLILKKFHDRFEATSLDLNEFPSDLVSLDRMHGQVGAINEELVFYCGGRQSPSKSNGSNINFIGRINSDNKLHVVHKFHKNAKLLNTCWRHKISRVSDNKIIQVGGISTDLDSSDTVVWDFSSDKLGYDVISFDGTQFLGRHSFAMDAQDENTLLIFGGLQTNQESRDRPVDSEMSVVLWDLRDLKRPIFIDMEYAKCYGSNVHFINSYQFVNIGGVSCITGLDNNVELIDLRNMQSLPVNKKDDQSRGHLMLLNTTTCHFEDTKEVITFGGGGSYFTFGTKFNQSHLVYQY